MNEINLLYYNIYRKKSNKKRQPKSLIVKHILNEISSD